MKKYSASSQAGLSPVAPAAWVVRRYVNVADKEASEALLYLPAYAALTVSVGAGCCALSRFINVPGSRSGLLMALLVAGAVSFSGHLPGRIWQAGVVLRWPLVALLCLSAVALRSQVIRPSDLESASDALIALMLGMVTIVSVSLVGVPSGKRRVPLDAPLIPGLALFGLLCLVAVDSVILYCFLVYVAGALYLLTYLRFLGEFEADPQTRHSGQAVGRTGSELPGADLVGRWAATAFLVCSVWFGLFMAGGAVLYYPVETALPRILAPQIARMRAAVRAVVLDYRGTSTVMELHGGDYPTSTSEVMRISVESGQPAEQWRGTTYDVYTRSRWQQGDSFVANDQRPNFSLNPVRDPSPKEVLEPVDPGLGHYRKVVESVVPTDGTSRLTYASGTILACHDTHASADYFDYGIIRAPYVVTSAVLEVRPQQLLSVNGYTLRQRLKLAPTSKLGRGLQLPQDPETRRVLQNIAAQIQINATTPLLTPYQKVCAVGAYLVQNCTYSLHSPQVPVTDDAVVYFLTHSRTGACDMFASSMALLLRTMGIPARIATGYIRADVAATTVAAHRQSREKPVYVVRERDAHAWVEYALPGLGWLTYDPTIGTRTVDETIAGQLAAAWQWPSLNFPVRLLVVLGAGVLLVILGLLWSRGEQRVEQAASPTEEDVRRREVGRAYRAAVRQIARQVPHQKQYTPREFEAAVSRSKVALAAKQELALLTHLYSASRYEKELPAVSATELAASLARLKGGLRLSKGNRWSLG